MTKIFDITGSTIEVNIDVLLNEQFDIDVFNRENKEFIKEHL